MWDWLEVSGSREQPTGLGSASDAVQFGQMHLSEGSPATTVITTALDVSRGDAVEPCVSSLLDAQVGSLLSLTSTGLTTALLPSLSGSIVDMRAGVELGCQLRCFQSLLNF